MKLAPANFRSYTTFILILVGIGLAVAWLIHQIFALFGLIVPWWLETPGAIGVAAAIFSIYDKYLWTWPIFNVLGLVDSPNIRGRWKGEVQSSHEKKPQLAFLEIKQTASNIVINLYAEHSHSISIDATFVKSPEGFCILYYGYENHPHVFSVETMQTHFGSVKLSFYPDIKELRGEYYTSRERGTYGTMQFGFEKKQLLGRFD